MHYYRFDGNILDFSRGPAEDRVLKSVDNCLVRERKERITLYSFDITMVCPGNYRTSKPLDFHMVKDKKICPMSCDRCYFALSNLEKYCSPNSFLLPDHFHHRRANFKAIRRILIASGYMQLPVPDPMTWSYMIFRY